MQRWGSGQILEETLETGLLPVGHDYISVTARKPLHRVIVFKRIGEQSVQAVRAGTLLQSVHQPSAVQECQFNKKAWDSISERDQTMIRLAARLNTFDQWRDHAYKDLFAYMRFEKSGNTMLRLEPSFIKAAQKAANEWADKQVAGNAWFKKMLNHQRQFQMDMQVYPKMRSGPGTRTEIGKIHK